LLDAVKVADVTKVCITAHRGVVSFLICINIKAAKALTAAKATYVAVGNVGALPYGDELGL
jgi:hypothetical protein